jgi:hypothetical protein
MPHLAVVEPDAPQRERLERAVVLYVDAERAHAVRRERGQALESTRRLLLVVKRPDHDVTRHL